MSDASLAFSSCIILGEENACSAMTRQGPEDSMKAERANVVVLSPNLLNSEPIRISGTIASKSSDVINGSRQSVG